MKLIAKLLGVTLVILSLNGCVSTRETSVNPCVWVKPITWSSKDTPVTLQEIQAHNLKYLAFCTKESK